MKICPKCGSEIKEGLDVCPNCGALSDDLQSLLDELSGNADESSEKGFKVADKKAVEKDVPKNENDSKEKVTDKVKDEAKKVFFGEDKSEKIKDVVVPVEYSEDDYEYEDDEEYANTRKKFIIGAIVAVIIALGLGGGFAYYQYSSNQTKIETKEKKAKEEKAKKEKKEKEAEEKAAKEAEEKAKEEAKKAKEEQEKKEAEEKAKKEAEEKAQQETQNNNTYNGNPSGLGSNVYGLNETRNANGGYDDEPGHMYEEDVAPGDARLYWVSDRTLTDSQLQAVARKFGASWTIGYIYAKHGYNISGYTKYGFTADTSDKTTAEKRMNAAERRNITALTRY